ncbi:hypothetical protein CXG81DRAFT_28535 [Caulochytrium protostelioides]|uniref:C2 domain-containing protein n=1 Tax=Caulochytrium protostelioides TaxID=1555241 RepID=A0A4P9WYS6_9FUNG|nr:hypothetical protein CXG81DRAFT_28535 [Caulochytrium protostelioides]|eukprot:RKO98661.1 hypothetical protein CXG81DRAFT_28535 [Caulochytrium protostelioides]
MLLVSLAACLTSVVAFPATAHEAVQPPRADAPPFAGHDAARRPSLLRLHLSSDMPAMPWAPGATRHHDHVAGPSILWDPLVASLEFAASQRNIPLHPVAHALAGSIEMHPSAETKADHDHNGDQDHDGEDDIENVHAQETTVAQEVNEAKEAKKVKALNAANAANEANEALNDPQKEHVKVQKLAAEGVDELSASAATEDLLANGTSLRATPTQATAASDIGPTAVGPPATGTGTEMPTTTSAFVIHTPFAEDVSSEPGDVQPTVLMSPTALTVAPEPTPAEVLAPYTVFPLPLATLSIEEAASSSIAQLMASTTKRDLSPWSIPSSMPSDVRAVFETIPTLGPDVNGPRGPQYSRSLRVFVIDVAGLHLTALTRSNRPRVWVTYNGISLRTDGVGSGNSAVYDELFEFPRFYPRESLRFGVANGEDPVHAVFATGTVLASVLSTREETINVPLSGLKNLVVRTSNGGILRIKAQIIEKVRKTRNRSSTVTFDHEPTSAVEGAAAAPPVASYTPTVAGEPTVATSATPAPAAPAPAPALAAAADHPSAPPKTAEPPRPSSSSSSADTVSLTKRSASPATATFMASATAPSRTDAPLASDGETRAGTTAAAALPSLAAHGAPLRGLPNSTALPPTAWAPRALDLAADPAATGRTVPTALPPQAAWAATSPPVADGTAGPLAAATHRATRTAPAGGTLAPVATWTPS